MATQSQTQENYDQLPGYADRWKAMLFIGISLLVISLDNTILNVALPSISTDLNASFSELQWIVDAYVLVFAAMLLTMGSISDRIGRKRALQGGLILFATGSLAAALSTSTNMLIASRAFLGLGGAIIMPSTLSIISASFPRHERAQAFAIWAAIFGLGVGVGPVTGGLLLEYFDWNSVFFVNLPVVAVALAGGAIFIAESKDEHAPKLDIPGVVLSVTGLFALIYGIIEAGSLGWTDSHVLTAFAAATVLLVAFTIWERVNPDAMLPLHFFKNMSFTGANMAMALVMFSMFGSIFFLTQYMQSVLAYTALEAGIRMLPLALTLMVVSASSARVAQKLGTKRVVALGIAISGAGLLLMSQLYEVDTSYDIIMVTMIFFAAGMGLTMSPATNSIMQSVPVSKAGIGSAMNDTTRQLGGAMGIAVLGTILNNTYLEGMSNLEIPPALLESALANVPANAPAATAEEAMELISSSVQGAHAFAAYMPDALAQQLLETANQAFVSGMSEAMVIGAGIMFAASLMALLILPSKVQRPEEEDEEITTSEHFPAPAPAPIGD
jgi:EmrB/QacA subfamily drug resistance transporter